MTIRNMTQKDWDYVARIYTEGISTGFAAFESTLPNFENWDKAHLQECRLIAEKETQPYSLVFFLKIKQVLNCMKI